MSDIEGEENDKILENGNYKNCLYVGKEIVQNLSPKEGKLMCQYL